jgi:tellurite resistance protein TerC
MIHHSLLQWGGFLLLIFLLLILDLGVFNRKAHAPSTREALLLSGFWICLALLFNGLVYYLWGKTPALEFLTGYLIEKALSVDNLFVFIMIFSYFGIQTKYQHGILFWGILGALIMRGLFIGAGTVLINRFEWVIYIFGVLLIYSAYKMFFHSDEDFDPNKNPILNFARKILPVKNDYVGPDFTVMHHSKRYVTPLFIVLLVVETSDVMFAVDSIPAIFAVTKDPFIIFTSNVFAILGLRALYFALASIMGQFKYLKHGVSVILAFVGVKMLIEAKVHISATVSLGVVFSILVISVLASLIHRQKET